jgi:hypothetical protein
MRKVGLIFSPCRIQSNFVVDENGRLKKLVADLSLDKEMLKAVIEKNGWSS